MTGNTKAIARKMNEIFEKYKHECDIHRDKEIRKEVEKNSNYFENYDILCLGSCTHGASPAISFNTFMNSFINYNLDSKSLICFSSSGFPNVWKNTCKNITEKFPKMNHLGNFGCTLRKIDTMMKSFEDLIKGL